MSRSARKGHSEDLPQLQADDRFNNLKIISMPMAWGMLGEVVNQKQNDELHQKVVTFVRENVPEYHPKCTPKQLDVFAMILGLKLQTLIHSDELPDWINEFIDNDGPVNNPANEPYKPFLVMAQGFLHELQEPKWPAEIHAELEEFVLQFLPEYKSLPPYYQATDDQLQMLAVGIDYILKRKASRLDEPININPIYEIPKNWNQFLICMLG
jgi:hypothetical protein